MELLNIDSYLSTLDVSARARVENSLRRTAAGDMVDIVTPLVPDGDPDVGRADLRDQLLKGLLPTGYSWLDEAEIAQAAKIGAYSYMLPWVERIPTANAYFAQSGTSINQDALRIAVERVARRLPRNLSPVSLDTAYQGMPKGTNLGGPFFTSDERYRPIVLQLAKDIEDNGYRSAPNDPCIVYFRGQPRGIGLISKNRIVWGYPHWLTLLELQLQEAALPLLRLLPEFVAWNRPDDIDEVITSVIDSARGQILSVDFSGYDASVPEVLIRAAFGLIRRMFNGDEQTTRLINLVEERFIHISLLCPDGIRAGSHSVPSGSAETNWIDGFIQMILWEYVSVMLNLPIRSITVQGDDGVVDFSGQWYLDTLEGIVSDFGMQVSADKGGISHDQVMFLQNIHSRQYRLGGRYVHIRPIMRILNAMMSQERFTKGWTGLMHTWRWMQQVEIGKNHPKFKLLVEFLYDRDRTMHTMWLDDFVHQSGGVKTAERLLKQRSFPYGKEALSGWKEWHVTAMLKELQHRYGVST
jgi:hypothetical protein